MSRTILIVAGEASGDALGAGLIRAARALDPTVRFVGAGGEAMREAGARILVDAREIAVVGILEVLSRLPRILRARKTLRRALSEEHPSLVLLVDYPDFNLRFARDAKGAGLPVHYFVSPQIWAWRAGRIGTIARFVDRMMVIFPFEEELYRRAGVPAVFVGHPLLDLEPPPSPREEARRRLGASLAASVLALLPGSRRGEIASLLPVQLEAAERLRRTRPGLEAFVPVASTVPDGLVETIVSSAGAAAWARPVRGLFYEVLDAADAAIVASGTATLQAGLRRTPMVVIYRTSPVTAWLGRRLLRVPDIGLVNLVAGRRVVPELVQEDCNPDAIAAAASVFLDDPEAARRTRDALGIVRGRLGAPGAFERAARLVLDEPPRS